MKKRLQVVLGIVAIIFVTVVFLAFTYLGNYYAYGNYARKALRDSETVKVTKEKGYIFFDGAGTDKAMIFYPGARVATEAYAPLMSGLAKEGIDCFLVDMPFHFAIFGRDRAAGIISDYSYDEYIMAGHSLGGAMAADYTAGHPGDVSALVLLASYPTKKIDDGIKFLSILGSNDRIINTEKYEKYKSNWSEGNSQDYLIFGGNHAGFGNYGDQDGDGEAKIKPKTQWKETISVIKEYLL